MIKPSTVGISTSDVILDIPQTPDRSKIKVRVIVQVGEVYITYEADTVQKLMELRREWTAEDLREAGVIK